MKTVVVCIAKDEDDYLEEWLEWHLGIGFDDAYVFMNDWRSSLDTSRWAQSGHKVLLVPFDGSSRQNDAYNSFIGVSQQYDWALFCDVDEFLVLKRHNDVGSMFNEYSGYFALGFNWKLFGSNGLGEACSDKSCIRRFTRSQVGVNQHIKTALNLSEIRNHGIEGKVKFINPHFVNTSLQYRFTTAPDKQTFIHGPFNRYGNDDVAYLAHFITKSRAECLERRSKRRADIGSPREEGAEAFFKAHDLNEIENYDLYEKGKII